MDLEGSTAPAAAVAAAVAAAAAVAVAEGNVEHGKEGGEGGGGGDGAFVGNEKEMMELLKEDIENWWERREGGREEGGREGGKAVVGCAWPGTTSKILDLIEMF